MVYQKCPRTCSKCSEIEVANNKSNNIEPEFEITTVNCEWSEWEFGHCSAECGEGTIIKTRSKLVEESNGGTCIGEPTETVECKIKQCPVDCQWNDWVVGECNVCGVRTNR